MSARLLLPTALFALTALASFSVWALGSRLQNQGPVALELPFERETVTTLARLSWGLFYGLGLGYGLAALVQGRLGASDPGRPRGEQGGG